MVIPEKTLEKITIRNRMMPTKKTVQVLAVKDKVNTMLKNPLFDQQEKRGMIAVLENILMDTGNYNGFQDIYWMQEGCKKWEEAGKPAIKYQYMGSEYDRYYF